MATKVTVDLKRLTIGNAVNVVKMRQALANEIVTVSDPLVPFDTGALKNSVTIANDGSYITYGGVGQSNAYARRLWYGDTFNFKGAPTRGSRWTTRAWANNYQQIMNTLQELQDKGVFK